MKKLVVLLLVSLMATSAFGQTLDPDTDMIGAYFDVGATTNSAVVGASIPTFVYITITNPSSPQVQGLEVGYRVEAANGAASLFRLLNALPAGAVDLGSSVDLSIGDYVVGLAAPIPSTEAVVFITWQFLLLVPGQVDIFLGPSTVESIADGLPAYETGGTIQSLGLSTGSVNVPVAVMNGDAPVANDQTSFGSVKSLFR